MIILISCSMFLPRITGSDLLDPCAVIFLLSSKSNKQYSSLSVSHFPWKIPSGQLWRFIRVALHWVSLPTWCRNAPYLTPLPSTSHSLEVLPEMPYVVDTPADFPDDLTRLLRDFQDTRMSYSTPIAFYIALPFPLLMHYLPNLGFNLGNTVWTRIDHFATFVVDSVSLRSSFLLASASQKSLCCGGSL